MNHTLPRPVYPTARAGLLDATLNFPVWVREYMYFDGTWTGISVTNAVGAVTATVHSILPGLTLQSDLTITGTITEFHTELINVTLVDSIGQTARVSLSVKCWPYCLFQSAADVTAQSQGMFLLDPNGPTVRSGTSRTSSLATVDGRAGVIMNALSLPANISTASSMNLEVVNNSTNYFFLREDANNARYLDMTGSQGCWNGYTLANGTGFQVPIPKQGTYTVFLAAVRLANFSSSNIQNKNIINTARLSTTTVPTQALSGTDQTNWGTCNGDGWYGASISSGVPARETNIALWVSQSLSYTPTPGGVPGTTATVYGQRVFNHARSDSGGHTSRQKMDGFLSTTPSVLGYHYTGLSSDKYYARYFTSVDESFDAIQQSTSAISNEYFTENLGSGYGNGYQAPLASYSGLRIGDYSTTTTLNPPVGIYAVLVVPCTIEDYKSSETFINREDVEMTMYFMNQIINGNPDVPMNWPSL